MLPIRAKFKQVKAPAIITNIQNDQEIQLKMYGKSNIFQCYELDNLHAQ